MNFRFSAADDVTPPISVSTAGLTVVLDKKDSVYETADTEKAAALRQVPSLQELKPTDSAPAPVPPPVPDPVAPAAKESEATDASKEAGQ